MSKGIGSRNIFSQFFYFFIKVSVL